jgi:TM2 domain-containing membrane protein YozV
MLKVIFTSVFVMALITSMSARTVELPQQIILVDTLSNDTIVLNTELASADTTSHRILFAKDETKKKKFVSSLLALPFPFGFLGAHRVMLGTKPWVPVVYIATFGGCFGLLPLIDFCVIVFSKDIEQYENNPRIFMWIK